VLIDCILVELYSVIARRSKEKGYDFSQIFPQIFRLEKMYHVIMAYGYREKLHMKVLDLMLSSKGALNYHDALISFAMKRERIRKIATFDRDFAVIDWLEVEH